MARELRAQRRSALAWTVPVASLVGFTVGLFPSMSQQNGLLAAKVAMMPPAVREAFGIALLDIGRPAGFLATNFLYVTLTGSLVGAMLGASAVSREEALHTAESLLTLPLPRSIVMLGKLATVALLVLGFHAVVGATAMGVFAAVSPGHHDGATLASLFVGAAALSLCFAGLGSLLGAVAPQPRSAPNLALGLVLGTYLLAVTARLSPRASALGWASPFRLFEPATVVREGLSAGPVLALGLVALVTGALSVAWFLRKDIHA